HSAFRALSDYRQLGGRAAGGARREKEKESVGWFCLGRFVHSVRSGRPRAAPERPSRDWAGRSGCCDWAPPAVGRGAEEGEQGRHLDNGCDKISPLGRHDPYRQANRRNAKSWLGDGIDRKSWTRWEK